MTILKAELLFQTITGKNNNFLIATQSKLAIFSTTVWECDDKGNVTNPSFTEAVEDKIGSDALATHDKLIKKYNK